jgi:hypothetical protein
MVLDMIVRSQFLLTVGINFIRSNFPDHLGSKTLNDQQYMPLDPVMSCLQDTGAINKPFA